MYDLLLVISGLSFITAMIPESVDLKAVNEFSQNSMVGYLGIEFIEVGKDYLKARMPVNVKTIQPYGLLHGGASVVLAETLGSKASDLILSEDQFPVGIEINANHIKSVRSGYVYGTATPVHLGRRTHVWSVEIKDEEDNMICVSRLTVAVVDKK
ncbi:hotdog fold thioesterase [Marinoscillum sp. MHG1-6]|uniref:hotdog fold thioesterase n=1 Tax=Marinoscillum sp. MHG1-6 TaxID=2959627 RepID=UPI00280C2564|nr:hotdog fold thioesterase [Marinoscillum sp. MHG1-6]